MNVSYAVQHHPSRAHLIGPLVARIGACDVVPDPEPGAVPSPLRTYRECLRKVIYGINDFTHAVVIQDDAWPCENFRELAEAAISERPSTLIAFFVSGSRGGGERRIMAAHSRGEHWAYIGGTRIVPLVATCWPTALVEPFLAFSEKPGYRNRTGDDGVAASFVKQNRLEVWATVPSLVEHPNTETSLIGRPAKGSKDRSRVAALFLDRP